MGVKFVLNNGREFPMVEVGPEEIELLIKSKPAVFGVPVMFSLNVPHFRPDTGEATGLTFTKVWPIPPLRPSDNESSRFALFDL